MKKITALFLTFVLSLSLIACGGEASSQASSNKANRPADLPVGDVTITLDNWQEYFDLKSEFEITTNNLGDVANTCFFQSIKLKEEYSDYCSASTVGFAIKESKAYMCEAECDTQTQQYRIVKRYTVDEIMAKYNVSNITYIFDENSVYESTADYTVYSNLKENGCSLNRKYESGDELSVSGTTVTWDVQLYDVCEITRVAGTLTFVEEPLKKW